MTRLPFPPLSPTSINSTVTSTVLSPTHFSPTQPSYCLSKAISFLCISFKQKFHLKWESMFEKPKLVLFSLSLNTCRSACMVFIVKSLLRRLVCLVLPKSERSMDWFLVRRSFEYRGLLGRPPIQKKTMRHNANFCGKKMPILVISLTAFWKQLAHRREERKAVCVAYSSSCPAFVNSCRNNYISSFKGTFSHALYGMKAEDARCFWLGRDVIRKGEKRTRLSDCMVGEAGRSWQGIEESSTLLNITTSPRDSVPPTPHNLTLGSLGSFSQFLRILLGHPEFLPLDTIALSCPPHLNSAILKRLKLQLCFLGSDNDSVTWWQKWFTCEQKEGGGLSV